MNLMRRLVVVVIMTALVLTAPTSAPTGAMARGRRLGFWVGKTPAPTKRPTAKPRAPGPPVSRDDALPTKPVCKSYVRAAPEVWATDASSSSSNVNTVMPIAVSAIGNVVAWGLPGLGVGGVVAILSRPASSPSDTPFTRDDVVSPTGPCARGGFGSTVAMDYTGLVLAVGDPTCTALGRVYMYQRNTTAEAFTYTQTVLGNTRQPFQGTAVALDAPGTTMLVASSAANANRGTVWVYTRKPGASTTWAFQAQLFPLGGVAMSQFGSSVALSADGNVAVVGGVGDSNAQGATWVFQRDVSVGTWSQAARLVGMQTATPPQPPVRAYNQGHAVAVSAGGGTIVTTAPNFGKYAGAAWVFRFVGGSWTSQPPIRLVCSPSVSDAQRTDATECGTSVAMTANADRVVLGDVATELDAAGDPAAQASRGNAWVWGQSRGVWELGAHEAPQLSYDARDAPVRFASFVGLAKDGSLLVAASFRNGNAVLEFARPDASCGTGGAPGFE